MDATLILLSQINGWHWGGGGSEFKLNWRYLSVLKQLGSNGMPTVLVNKSICKATDQSIVLAKLGETVYQIKSDERVTGGVANCMVWI